MLVERVLRGLVAAGLLGSAWVHLSVWLDWARDTAVVGPLFLVNVVAGVVIAVAVVVSRHPLSALAAVGFGVATLAAYVLSLTVGFFGVHERFATRAELWGVITEAACVVFGLVLLTPTLRRGRHRVDPAAGDRP
ncbi:hypothetical protein [Saccharomonospora halophila]|uniref:hypothetical protein n=1 Tax=Saccharomonospora halophila TaxID=129922 RepID=UPI000378F130|nr:hypothetical protein [Saccharomonospora halophila]